MAKTRPITDKDRAAVRRLHAEGKTRNEIARQLKRSPSTVSKLAVEQGLSFDRAGDIAIATENKRAQLADRRATLALDLQTDAERLRAQLWQACTVGEFAGKEGHWQSVDLPQPRFGDQRQIISSAATAIQQSLRLAPAGNSEGVEQAKSLITGLFDGLRITRREATKGDDTPVE